MAKDRRLKGSYNPILQLYRIAAPCSNTIRQRQTENTQSGDSLLPEFG